VEDPEWDKPDGLQGARYANSQVVAIGQYRTPELLQSSPWSSHSQPAVSYLE
jgi:hypothetical protein